MSERESVAFSHFDTDIEIKSLPAQIALSLSLFPLLSLSPTLLCHLFSAINLYFILFCFPPFVHSFLPPTSVWLRLSACVLCWRSHKNHKVLSIKYAKVSATTRSSHTHKETHTWQASKNVVPKMLPYKLPLVFLMPCVKFLYGSKC